MRSIRWYRLIFIVFVGIGPFMSLDMIFILADIVNGLMALPNLIGLIGLRKVIIAETTQYFQSEPAHVLQGEPAEEGA